MVALSGFADDELVVDMGGGIAAEDAVTITK
jgi:hypothetical protein